MRTISNSNVVNHHGAEVEGARHGHLIFAEAEWQAIARDLRLSGRELQIVHCILEDRKEHAIAERLEISVHTVRNHLSRLYHKLGVHSRLALATRVMAERERLVGRGPQRT